MLCLKKNRKYLNHGGEYLARLTDLSKCFDCHPHDFLIPKLHAHDFDTSSLKHVHNYLTNRYQRVKMNNSYNVFNLTKYGVPQGSIIGPIPFYFFLCGLFLIAKGIDIASFADDNTLYCTLNVPDVVKISLKTA